MKALRLFIVKFLVSRFGFLIEKHAGEFWSNIPGTNVEFILSTSCKAFLKQKHRVFQNRHVQIHVKASHGLENKLTRCGSFWNTITYKHEGSSYTIDFCEHSLYKCFGHIPDKISYTIKFIYKNEPTMKKPLTAFATGVVLGVAAVAILDAIFSPAADHKKTSEKRPERPETIESLNRKRIVAVSEERYEDAARLRDQILNLKVHG